MFKRLGMGMALAWAAAMPARAADPLLGVIKAIQCKNCDPGFITLVIHDPIDLVDFEVLIPDTAYNKILTPLPGKSVLDQGGACFYWLQKPKVDTTVAGPTKPPEDPEGIPSTCIPYQKKKAPKPKKK
jgi:hypothetical protein